MSTWVDQSRSKRLFTAIFLALILTVLAATLSLSQVSADSHLTSTPSSSKMLPGPYIEMQVDGLPTGPDGIWTAIEWLDPYTGQWTLVEGWQGTVETDDTQVWWVSADDYGTGPFRWLAFDEEGGDQLGLSDEFNLPAHSNEVVVVQMKPLGQD